MKGFVFSSTVLVACDALASLESEWDKFKTQFAKTYENDAEETNRMKVFSENMDFINAENSKGHTYTLGVTQFADLTNEEFKTVNWGLLQLDSDEGLPYLGEHTFKEDFELPASVDWSYHGAVTGIKNQGQCGSCWAFSGIGALEGANQIATGRLVSLSEQQMVDCDGFPNRGCGGGQMTTVFGHAKKNGVCTEGSYRYEMRGDTCREKSCSLGISKGMVKGYKKVAAVPGLTSASERGLMTAVAQQPVSIGIEADKPVFQHYRGGVLDGACGGRVDHGVLAVGYGTTGGVDYWKVKNSWGASWGSNGYVFLKRGKSLSGECGILSQPSYPVMASAEVAV